MASGVFFGIQQFLEKNSHETTKQMILALLTAAALLLTYVNLGAGNEIVFTHFFYVPIIIAAYWYRFRGAIYAVLLSILYILAVYFLADAGSQSLLAAYGRVIVFIGIAIVVAVLSEMIARQKEELVMMNSQLLRSNRELEETGQELRNSIEELGRTEQNLLASRERIQLILESSGEGILGIDRNASVTFINPAGSRMLGYDSPPDLVGMDVCEVLHRDPSGDPGLPHDNCSIKGTLRHGNTLSCDTESFRRKDGTLFPAACCYAPLIRDGTVDGAVISFEDITERVNLLDQLKSSLKEKESLLKEIHHRVKNNLQIVVSLLNMQARYVTDQQMLDVIRESQSRVRMMALVHERLYRSGDLSHIDMEEYIQFLTSNLFKFYGFPQSQVTRSVHASGVILDINTAIPLGLICNELISNSLKYAFPDGRKGEISVAALSRPDSSMVVTVRDNGLGMPEGMDWQNADSLGLKLVNLFTDQLNGQISMRQDGGTIWEITIPRAA